MKQIILMALLIILTFPLLSISGHITSNTSWNTEQVVTGDLWIDSGITLTIHAGVHVKFPFLDSNNDQIGDIDFIVNGRLIILGTESNKVFFESYESTPGKRDWGGIDILTPQSGSSSILNWVDLTNANQGIHLNGKGISTTGLSVKDTYDYGFRAELAFSPIDITNSSFETSNGKGILIENATAQLTNVLCYLNNDDGLYITGSANVTATQLISASNGGNGVNLNNALAFNLTYSKLILNEVNGLKTVGSNTVNVSYTDSERNTQCGFFVKTTPAQLTYCNIRYNQGAGVMSYLSSDTITYNNIYGNLGIPYDEIVDLNYPTWGAGDFSNPNAFAGTTPMPGNIIPLPIFISNMTYRKTREQHAWNGSYFNSRISFDGEIYLDNSTYGQGLIDLTISGNIDEYVNSSSIVSLCYELLHGDQNCRIWVSQIKHRYYFTGKQISVWNPTQVHNYQYNWWGQVTGIDSLVWQYYNNSANYSSQSTLEIEQAGSGMINLSPTITLNTPATLVTNQTQTTLDWSARDIDDDAEISLFYDLTQNFQGTQFISGISEDHIASYTWDYSTIPDGIYYVYAEINDGVNPIVRSYAPGRIVKGPFKIFIPNDLYASQSEVLSVPVYLSNVLPQYNVISYQATVTYNPNLVTCTGFDTSETISDNWIVTINTSVPGQVTFNGFGTSAIQTPGVLLKLIFIVSSSAVNNQTTELIFNSAQVNNNTPAITTGSGLITILNRYSFSGTVKYYSNNIPMRDVRLTAAGQSSGTQDTNVMGQYSFNQMYSGAYSLTPSFEGSVPDLVITPYDASLVARYAVGSITLTPNQLIASDVNDDGEVSVFDAALIAQYSVELIPSFDSGDIVFIPSSLSFQLNNNITNQQFNAIAIGDPSGNWAYPTSNRYESLEPLVTRTDEGEFSIEFRSNRPFLSYLIKLNYDPSAVQIVNHEYSSSVADFQVLENIADGYISLAGFGVVEASNTQPALTVTFISTDEDNPNPIRILACTFDELSGTTGVVSANDLTTPITTLSLCQNYPNPFNPKTRIKYTLPTETIVELDIYNLKGQKVETLVYKNQQKGDYTATWDASSYGSGVYLYRLKANGNTITRRMILMK